MVKITGDFNWKVPSVIASFIQGKDAKAIYDSVKGLGLIDYDEKSQTLRGDNTFISARIDTQLQPLGIRVATLKDLSRPEVMEMIKGKHYTNTPAFVLRTMEDSYKNNLPLIKRLAELVEEKNGKLKLPALITGFDVQSSENEGYEVKIIARDDFTAVFDERLKGCYNGKNFSEVDEETALPKFDGNGTRVWYARDKGLSRLCLTRFLDLFSDGESLAYSDADGRVVVISGEAMSQKIDDYIQKLKAESVLRGKK